MRRLVTYLMLSLFLVCGTYDAFANGTNDRGRDRKEHRDNHRSNPRNHNNKKNDKYRPGKDNNKNHNNDKYRPGGNNRPGKPGNSHYKPGNNHSAMPPGRPVNNYRPAPTPPPPPHTPVHYAPAPPPPPRLAHMVRHATRGCHDVNVWQVDPETFVVRYRYGNRLYTRYIYPYSDIYGVPSLISVNWQPRSPWTLIPPIQLNINL